MAQAYNPDMETEGNTEIVAPPYKPKKARLG